jgi:hypothetical protein|tara:strand:- start:35 stop:736 length:702 start_codon:yes stop_codon:yes gene_type:complete
MKKTMLILIILASLIPGTLAVVQYFDSAKKEKENIIRENNLNKKIKDLLDDNVNLSHQLTETALELNNNVIGASDLDIQINNTKNTEFNFRFKNDSDLPIVNAHITIQNYTEIKKCEVIKETENQIHINLDCYKDNFIKQSGININPNGAILFDNKSFNCLKGYMNFEIQIETRKKTIIYHLVYKIINGEMEKSFRIYNLLKGKKIFISEKNPLKLSNDFWENNFYEKLLFTK